jgi:hypothetical protein
MNRERRAAANWRHDMERAQWEHRQPVCPDCFKPAKECFHREAWEFLRRPAKQ